MNDKAMDILTNDLFTGVSANLIEKVFSDKNMFHFNQYDKNQTIAIGDEFCENIGFITKGFLSIQHISYEGDITSIALLKKGDCFGEALLFGSSNYYPYNLVAFSDLTIIYVNKKAITALLGDKNFSINYLKTLSDKVSILKDKLLILSQKSLRNKILLYFHKEVLEQGSHSFIMKMSVSDLANHLNAERPSVSRELKNMQNDGLILKNKKKITILKTNIFNKL